MKSKDFIIEAPIDQTIAQAQQPQQPKLPYNQSRIGNKIGKGLAKGFAGVGQMAAGANKAIATGAGTTLSAGTRLHKSGYGAGAQLSSPSLDYLPGKIDANVVDYLTQAANKQPLKTGTGNTGIDNILRATGLLK